MDREKLEQLAHSHLTQEKYALLSQEIKNSIVTYAVIFLRVATYEKKLSWTNKQVYELREEQMTNIKKSATELSISYNSLDLYILGTCRKVHEMIMNNVQSAWELDKIKKQEKAKNAKWKKYGPVPNNPGRDKRWQRYKANNDYYGSYNE